MEVKRQIRTKKLLETEHTDSLTGWKHQDLIKKCQIVFENKQVISFLSSLHQIKQLPRFSNTAKNFTEKNVIPWLTLLYGTLMHFFSCFTKTTVGNLVASKFIEEDQNLSEERINRELLKAIQVGRQQMASEIQKQYDFAGMITIPM